MPSTKGAVAIAAAVSLLLAACSSGSDDADDTGEAMTTTAEETTTSADSSSTTSSADSTTPEQDDPAADEPVDEFERLSGMPWASPDDAHQDPVDAVEAFVTFIEDAYPGDLGAEGPDDLVIGEFAAGDQRSGEVEVEFGTSVLVPGSGPAPDESDLTAAVTTVLVRKAGPADTWWVTGAESNALEVIEPAAGSTVTSAFHLVFFNRVESDTGLLAIYASGAAAPFYRATDEGTPGLAGDEFDVFIDTTDCEMERLLFFFVTVCDGPAPAGTDGTLILAHNLGVTTVPIVFADT